MSTGKFSHTIIAGGSISGLCAAIVLLTAGRRVAVYERNSDLSRRDEGAGIVVGEDLLKFMKEYKVTTAAWTTVSKERQILNSIGEIIGKESRAQHTTSWTILYMLLRSKADSLSHGKRYYYDGASVVGFQIAEDGSLAIQIASSKDGTITRVHADTLLAADGANSNLRKALDPTVSRQLVGYIAWRGIVAEADLDKSTRFSLSERLSFFHGPGTQMITYSIPSSLQDLSERFINFVWYCNCPPSSAKYHQIMTDAHGTLRHATMPAGKLSAIVWSEGMELASRILPPVLVNVVKQADKPFVQVIMDVLSPKAVWMGGRVILLGDAVAGFRPHTGASTNQAALHALKLSEWVDSPDCPFTKAQEYEEAVMRYASDMYALGKKLGAECQQPIEN